MTKILTLEDVGIPNVSEKQYLALPLQDRIAMMLKISDRGETLDSQVNTSRVQNVVGRLFQYNLSETISEEDLFKSEFTYRRLGEMVEGLVKEREAYCQTKNLPEEFFGMAIKDPYWLNSFPNLFFSGIITYRGGTSSSSHRDFVFNRRLGELTKGVNVPQARKKLKTDFETDKFVYPYYITLKREGFSDAELDG